MQCRQILIKKLPTQVQKDSGRPWAQPKARVVDLGAKAENKGRLRGGRAILKEEVGSEMGTGS